MRPEEMVGQMLGHYRILRPLGYGGTATVFLAQDIHLQRDVAIKVFLPKDGDTQDFLRRFAREARVLAQLDHPNILPVYEYGEEGSLAFLVMPHMAGGSLRDWLHGHGAVPPMETLQLIQQILSALQYAHERNLIHRDIKPGNMLFKADGTLMLSDFGLVKILAGDAGISMLPNDSASISTQELTGTPDYMAPEQIQGKVVPASDIYAVGVVLYEMLTGNHLFSAENYVGVLVKHMYEQPRPLHEMNPHISPALEFVVLNALHKDPTQRYQHPSDLQQALLQAIRADSSLQSDTSIASNTLLPLTPFSALTSLPERENNYANRKTTPPTHLHAPQPSPITQSDAYPATITPSPGQTLPSPISYPGPLTQATPPTPLQRPRSSQPLIGILILVILALLAGLGGVVYNEVHTSPPLATVLPQTHVPTTGITPVDKGGTTPIAGNTQLVPKTQVTCPLAGQGRAAITAPLALGSQANVVYIVNEEVNGNPVGTIKRRVANFQAIKGVEISKMVGTYVNEAQVSQDGQWVLFVVTTGNQSELRMVRVDGQGLQTLYCAPANAKINSSQWSFDQRTIVFNVVPDTGMPTLYLLDATTGNVQTELIPQSTQFYTPRTWLDNTHIYMTSFVPNPSGGSTQNLYILDIKNGAHQNDRDLQKIAPGLQPCGSFDSSYDSTQLLISSCHLGPITGGSQSGPVGPTTITSEAVTGGPTKTIQTLDHAVTMLRAISPTTLLLLIENANGDTSSNGLWKMNVDGTGLTQLSTDKNTAQSLCQFSQYAWSNVSRDGSLYAFQEAISNATTGQVTYNMYYGPMSGIAQPYEFADITGTQLLLAGWTSL
jgi:eukaryotic-like serine/threonine-protein kinase